MVEWLEHYGTPCRLPEENIVGYCKACDSQIYEYEQAECEICNALIHDKCIVRCGGCRALGCKICMTYDPDKTKYFCCEDCWELTE